GATLRERALSGDCNTLRRAQVRRISWVRGVRPVRERCERPPHATASGRPPAFWRWSLLGPDDGPTFFAELDQCDDAGLHALGILDKGWFLAFFAGHCLKRVLAGHERDIRHALLKRFQPRPHRGGIIAQHV